MISWNLPVASAVQREGMLLVGKNGPKNGPNVRWLVDMHPTVHDGVLRFSCLVRNSALRLATRVQPHLR